MGNITRIDRNFHHQEVPQNGTFSNLNDYHSGVGWEGL